MNREHKNFQFDFLRPQHSLFNYFTKLVEQYTKVSRRTKQSLIQWNRHQLFEQVFDDITMVSNQRTVCDCVYSDIDSTEESTGEAS